MKRIYDKIFQFYWGEGIADDVPALTYYLLVSLVPFALGVAILAAIVLPSTTSTSRLTSQIGRFTPPEIKHDLVTLIQRIPQISPLLLTFSVLAMLWTSSGAIGVIERALARMLSRPRHNILIGRLRNVALGAAVAVMFIAAAFGTGLVIALASDIELNRTAVKIGFYAINLIGSFLLTAIVYHFAPYGRLNWKASAAGGVPAAIGLQVLPILLGIYVNVVGGSAPVQIFFIFAAVLFSFFLMSLIFLVGAGIAARVQRRIEAE